jgi:Arc/MetJ family transcription regulator
MRTTIDLDESLLSAAMKVTQVRTKTEVVELGLRALIEQAAPQRLALLAGTVRRASAPSRRRSPRRR